MSESQVKDVIVEAATKYFSKYGFSKTTMDEIARHIHKAKGVLYYYFKSKEELFNEVLKKELTFVKSELTQIVNTETDALVTLKTYFLARLRLLNASPHYHETLKADFFEKYHFVIDVREDFAEYERAQLTLILNKGKEEGYLDVRDINSTVNTITMLGNSIEIPLFLQNKYAEYENSLEELVGMIIRGLKNQKASQ